MLKREKGITLVVLIMTVILMLILIAVGIDLGKDVIKEAALEDIKTNMLSIKTKAKTIEEKYSFGDIEHLVGKEVDKSTLNNTLQTQLGENTVYKWDQDILNEQGLTEIKVDDTSFYIVYYDEENATCEVYYSTGFNYNGETKYSLTELEGLE